MERYFQSIFKNILSPVKFPPGSAQLESKSNMLGERAYRVIFYLGCTIYLFVVLKSSDFLDVMLLGDATFPSFFVNYPCQNLPMYLDGFYVHKMSFYLYELVNTLTVGRHREDFPEYVLHHLMTWALILFSYSMNYIPIGAVILLVHDVSDIPATTLKLVVDTTSSLVESLVFGWLLISWAYFRLYVFPVRIIYRLITECYFVTVPAVNYTPMNMELAFLCGLMCLHVFWFYLMLKGLVRRITQPKSKVIMFKDSATRI